jgi:MFS family permease
MSTTVGVVQWTTTGYALGMVTVMPLAAWLSDRAGSRRTYWTARAVLAAASIAASCAPGIGWLVAARGIQGVGGGLVNPVGTAIGLAAMVLVGR